MGYIDEINVGGIDSEVRDTGTRKTIAPTETTSYASKAYAKDAFFIWDYTDGKVYQATAAIAKDAQFVVGTNIKLIGDIGDAINQAVTDEASTRASAINTEASIRAAADTALGTRIDQIVAPTGEAPNPAEITDARIGVDDTVYDNLGNAIRTQVENLSVFSHNLINENTMASGNGFVYWLVNLEPGTYTVSVKATNDNDDIDYTRLYVSKANTVSAVNKLYEKNIDKNKYTVNTFTVSEPIKAIYLFAGANSSQYQGHTVTVNQIQIERGDSATPYLPYRTANDYYARNMLGVLEPSGDTSDRAADILEKLNIYGRCILLDGEYYISQIYMPKNSTIEGIGKGTIIKAIGTDMCIITRSGCTIKNLEIDGGLIDIPSVVGNQVAIAFAYTNQKLTTIKDCYIHGFSGSGILLRDQGRLVDTNCTIDNCTIEYCYYGILIQRDSEFNSISNCTIAHNNIGVLSRGGNNKIVGCEIGTNILNIQIDNEEGGNGGHGLISGCTINHSNNNLDDGYNIIIKGTGRMMITGCLFYYGKIRLENTNQNIFDGCKMGNQTPLEILDSGPLMFSNTFFQSYEHSPITKNNNKNIIFDNCYYADGTPYQENNDEISVYSESLFSKGYCDTSGTIIDPNSPIIEGTWEHIVIPCERFDTFIFECLGGMGSRLLYCFCDAQMNILKKSYPSGEFQNSTFPAYTNLIPHNAPVNAAYVIVNHKADINNGYTPKVYKLSKNEMTNYIAERITAKLPYKSMSEWENEVVATYENMIVIRHNGVLKLSEDLGKTWNEGVSISGLGSIRNYYLYANGTLAFFTDTGAYYIEDWITFHEASCYEQDGSSFTPNPNGSNFDPIWVHNERKFIGQQDIYVFSNYNYSREERRLVWYSIDNGHSYKIAYEFSLESTYLARHIHDIIYYETEDTFIVTTGDSNATECAVYRFDYDVSNDSWSVIKLGGPSRDYKWANVAIYRNIIYYTYDSTPGKVMKCAFSDIGDITKHEVVIAETENDTLSLAFSKTGELIVAQSTYRSTGGANVPIDMTNEEASRIMYYSTNRKDFNAVVSPLNYINTPVPWARILPITNDGKCFIGTTKEVEMLPSLNLGDFLNTIGYRNAFHIF